MEQDHKGFLWFGTDKGLSRFDGTRFKTFGVKDGLPDPEVLNIFEDSQGRLWLSCFQKKPCYLKDGKFVTEETDSLLRKANVKSGSYTFYEDVDSSIWITNDKGHFCQFTATSVNCFNSPKASHKMKAGSKGTYPSLPMTNVQRLGDNLYGFARVKFYEIHEDEPLEEVFNVPRNIFHENTKRIKSFGETKFIGDYVLYSLRFGLVMLKYTGTGFEVVDWSTPWTPGFIFTDREGTFWVADPDEGVSRYDTSSTGLVLKKKYLEGRTVTHVFQDRQGTHWFATPNNGIYALPKNAAETFASPQSPFHSNNLTAIAKLPDGDLLLGDDVGAIYSFDGKAWKTIQNRMKNDRNRVREIILLDNDRWLAATDYFAIHGKSNSSSEPKTGAINYGTGKQAAYYNQKTWFGTSDYLLSWKNSPDTFKIELNSRITVVTADLQGNMWVGGLNGLFSEKDSFQIKWGEQFPELKGRIADIQPAGPDALWVATPSSGLLQVSTKNGRVVKVETINEYLENPIENIRSIFSELDGKVWMATNTGVFSLDKNLNISHFDKKNGLINNDINAVLVDGDTLWAATVSGLSRLVLKTSGKPRDYPTFFTGIRYQIDNREVELDLIANENTKKNISLPGEASSLEIEMAGLHFQIGNTPRYHFFSEEKLLPITHWTWDNLYGWASSRTEEVIWEGGARSYGVDIPSGRYRMVLTSLLPDNIRSTQPDEMVVTAWPHWTETVWVHLLAFFTVGYLVWFIVNERTARRRSEYTANKLQLAAIKAQINPHFVGNSINAIQQFFYPPDPEKASQYISTFTELLRRTMMFSEKNFIPFQDEVAFVEDYLKMIQLRFGERFQFEITGTEPITSYTPFPAMILQPILENATLHGLAPEGTSRLLVAFEEKQDRLYCTVTDNGIGTNASKARRKMIKKSRESKGISLLHKKIKVLNQVQNLDLEMEIIDLSEKAPGLHGTEVQISFIPSAVEPDFKLNESKNQ